SLRGFELRIFFHVTHFDESKIQYHCPCSKYFTIILLSENFLKAISLPAPQATLMATLAKGILSFNLDWQFVMVGVFIAVMIELCGIKALAFAIGLYLPLATTLPIFIGGAIKGYVDYRAEKNNEKKEEDDLGRGSLFATGLIAGGAITGVLVAILTVASPDFMGSVNLEHGIVGVLGQNGYFIMGVLFFSGMGLWLYQTAVKKEI
ncbi:MAG: OPT/YSL family transporter, partial [Cytophagales bacterium]|nr:OPT/YSL family transporter [Cytophagales bacterium]